MVKSYWINILFVLDFWIPTFVCQSLQENLPCIKYLLSWAENWAGLNGCFLSQGLLIFPLPIFPISLYFSSFSFCVCVCLSLSSLFLFPFFLCMCVSLSNFFPSFSVPFFFFFFLNHLCLFLFPAEKFLVQLRGNWEKMFFILLNIFWEGLEKFEKWCVYVCMCVCVYIYIYIYIHTHIQ